MAEDKEIQEGKIFALIGYLWILCFVPLLLKKENKFALFHGKQALVLFLGEIACSIIIMIPILGFIGLLFLFIFAVMSLLGIIHALMGNYWRIPVIADVADKFNI